MSDNIIHIPPTTNIPPNILQPTDLTTIPAVPTPAPFAAIPEISISDQLVQSIVTDKRPKTAKEAIIVLQLIMEKDMKPIVESITKAVIFHLPEQEQPLAKALIYGVEEVATKCCGLFS